MKFLALIYNDERMYQDATPADIAATFEAHGKFGAAAGEAGVFLGGDGLQPVATATTIRVRDFRVALGEPRQSRQQPAGGKTGAELIASRPCERRPGSRAVASATAFNASPTATA